MKPIIKRVESSKKASTKAKAALKPHDVDTLTKSLKKLVITESNPLKRGFNPPLKTPSVDDIGWGVISSYFDTFGFVQHQIDSFNRTIERGIPDLIMRTICNILDSERRVLSTIRFSNVVYDSPHFTETDFTREPVTPMKCTYRKITYASNISVDVIETRPGSEPTVTKGVYIGSIPVMVRSNLCVLPRMGEEELRHEGEDPLLPGGFFVIRGSEKVLLCQERQAYNRVYSFENRNTHPRYDVFTEVRSNPYGTTHTTLVQVGLFLTKDDPIGVILPYLPDTQSVPLVVVFAALGITDKETIAKMCCPCPDAMKFLLPSLELTPTCSQDEALNFIGTRGRRFAEDEDDDAAGSDEGAESFAQHVLNDEFLPHCSTTQGKIYFLAYMVRKLLMSAIFRSDPVNAGTSLEDRDHYANKRLFTAGGMLFMQFQTAFQRLVKEIRTQMEKTIIKNPTTTAASHIKAQMLTQTMANAISSNKWGIRGTARMVGVAQMYDRYNYIAALANLRKIHTTIGEGGKVLEPRQLHESHLGIIDPSDTPEGKTVGLSKALAVTCYVSVGTSPNAIIDVLSDVGLLPLDIKVFAFTKVMVNGDWIGSVKNASSFVDELRSMRRQGLLSFEVSIALDKNSNEIRIWTDSGRLMRPMFVVEGGELLFTKEHAGKLVKKELTFMHLLSKGVVEFLDKDEEDYGVLVPQSISALYEMDASVRKRVTHCELHASCMYGVSTSTIPFPDHNQAPRNTYQDAMSKQAMGIPGFNFLLRMGADMIVMFYLQRALTTTKMSKLLKMDQQPMGVNACTAILPYMGFNEEDSIVLNKDSLDRGMFDGFKIFIYEVVVRASRKEEVQFSEKNDIVGSLSIRRGNTTKLDVDGIVSEGTRLEDGDIMVLKTVPGKDGKPEDASLKYEEPWPGTVSKVLITDNVEGYKCIRIQVHQRRRPVIGDKFAARCAQKGTVGAIVPAVDLPYSEDGIIPDLVFNPLGHPKRMTIAYFLEVICGKTLCTTSKLRQVHFDELFAPRDESAIMHPAMDATPFHKFDVTEIQDELESHGFNRFGETRMYSGVTGQPLRCLVYMGPIYYQRLKHHAVDKVHARATGPRTSLSHQPNSGREFDGGLRSGEMERDNYALNGAAAVLCDRLCEQSDEFKMWVCHKCGTPALYEEEFSRTRNAAHGSAAAGRLPVAIRMCRVCGSSELYEAKLPYGSKLFLDELAAMGVVTSMFRK